MATTKRDVVEAVTARIVAALEAGVAPWVKPWSATGPSLSMPVNGHTGRAYRGMNVLILLGAQMAGGYAESRWVTFNQAREMGGSVRKGEKGTEVVLWKPIAPKDGELAADGTPARPRIFARSFYVFNVAQCDLPSVTTPAAPAPVAVDPIAAIDDAVRSLGVALSHGGGQAFYSPTSDTVRMPERAAFATTGDYYSTLLHEVAHWTGHKSRLDRAFGKRFGDDAYAAEELVAELSAAFLCAHFGIEGKLQHAEYIGHWVKVMKADKYAVFTAAKEAQRVLDFVLGATAIAAGESNDSETTEGVASMAA